MLRRRPITLTRADDACVEPARPMAPDGEPPLAARWEEAWPKNLCGVASALTTCSSIGGLGVLRLRLFFWLRHHIRPLRTWDARPLANLSFIHFAQWALIDRLPGNDGMDDQLLRPRYLLFLTNFNGGFDQYIDAFSHVIGSRIRLIWSGSHGFPGPEPATTFNEYIHRQEFAAAHFYSAYPDATTTRVRDALRTAERFESFVAAAHEDPFEFQEAWTALLTDVQGSL